MTLHCKKFLNLPSEGNNCSIHIQFPAWRALKNGLKWRETERSGGKERYRKKEIKRERLMEKDRENEREGQTERKRVREIKKETRKKKKERVGQKET